MWAGGEGIGGPGREVGGGLEPGGGIEPVDEGLPAEGGDGGLVRQGVGGGESEVETQVTGIVGALVDFDGEEVLAGYE